MESRKSSKFLSAFCPQCGVAVPYRDGQAPEQAVKAHQLAWCSPRIQTSRLGLILQDLIQRGLAHDRTLNYAVIQNVLMPLDPDPDEMKWVIDSLKGAGIRLAFSVDERAGHHGPDSSKVEPGSPQRRSDWKVPRRGATMRIRIRTIMPSKASGGHYGYEWSLAYDDQMAPVTTRAWSSWAKVPNGALLQGLGDVLADVDKRDRHAAVLVENVTRSTDLDAVLFESRPKSGKLWKSVLEQLDRHPVRVQYTADEYRDRTGPERLPWPSDEVSTEAEPTIAVTPELMRELEELREDVERLHDREARLLQENEALRTRLAAPTPLPPPRPPAESLSTSMTDLVESAETRVKSAWAKSGPDVWQNLPSRWRTIIVGPLFQAELVRQGDPLGDDSYETAAFQLARNTEYIVKQCLVPALVAWMDQHPSQDHPRADTAGVRTLTLAPRSGYDGTRTIQIGGSDGRRAPLTLDDGRWIFWDADDLGNHRQEQRPSEWQHAVRGFLEDDHLAWMMKPAVGHLWERLHKDVRNPLAHASKHLDETTYREWEQRLVTGESGWWREWMAAALQEGVPSLSMR